MHEERAAIMEYDAGMSRAEAEAAAWADVFGKRVARLKIDDWRRQWGCGGQC
jgi:hypothetical protein